MPRRRTPQISSIAQQEPVPISKLEYKFDGCPEEKFDSCPREELFDCLRYELARELCWLREFAAKQKAKKLKELAGVTCYSFLLFPQWPAQPYLSINPSERQRILRVFRLIEKEFEANFFEPQPEKLQKGIETELRRLLEQTGTSVIKSRTERMQISLFHIDWKFANSKIKQFFESYLEKHRPSGVVPTEHRRRNVPEARQKQQLKELGMFRILRANKDFSVNAIHKAFGREIPIYKVNAWYRAGPRSEALIKEFDTKMSAVFADLRKGSVIAKVTRFRHRPKREMIRS
jgi:hypothetical protein